MKKGSRGNRERATSLLFLLDIVLAKHESATPVSLRDTWIVGLYRLSRGEKKRDKRGVKDGGYIRRAVQLPDLGRYRRAVFRDVLRSG